MPHEDEIRAVEGPDASGGGAPKEPQFAHPMKEARRESGLLAFAMGY
jgi:hypothetical protein